MFTGAGSLCYLLCGLYYLKKILKSFSFSDAVVAMVIGAIVGGTNLFYYTLGQPSMSHLFSFFAINAFLWSCMRFSTSPSNSLRVKTAFFLAMVILLRPTNILVLIIVPMFLNGSPTSAFIKNLILKSPLFVLTLFSLLMVQPLLWYFQTGNWLIMSYPDEGFYFNRPRIIDFLFSFRRGWFVYTPLMLTAVSGIIFVKGKKHVNLPAFLLFFALLIYISSSWWCWYYGDGFGQRPMIDFYGVFAVFLASALGRLKSEPLRTLAFSSVYLCILLNLFQTWQFSHNYISRDNMNYEKYCHVFLRTADEYRGCLGGCTEEPFYRSDLSRPLAAFRDGKRLADNAGRDAGCGMRNAGCRMRDAGCGMQDAERRMPDAGCRMRDAGASNRTAFLFTPEKEFGGGIEVTFDSISKYPSKIYCDIRLNILDGDAAASNQAVLVISIDSLNSSYNYYNAIGLNDIPYFSSHSWRPLKITLNLPKILNPRARLKIYIWNPGRGTFTVDGMEIRIYGTKDAGRMQDARCGMQDAGCRMRDAGCRMRDAGCGMRDAGCGMT